VDKPIRVRRERDHNRLLQFLPLVTSSQHIITWQLHITFHMHKSRSWSLPSLLLSPTLFTHSSSSSFEHLLH
jgi:hypothetical protein